MKKLSKNIKNYKKEVLLYTAVFLVILIINRANVVGFKIPLSAAFSCSLIYLKLNAFIVTCFYILSNIIYSFSLINVIITLSTAAFMLLLYLIHRLINKKISFFAFLLGQVAFVYFNMTSPVDIIVCLITIVVSIMFLYISCQSMQAILIRGVQSRFTFDESICFAIFLIATSSGLSSLNVFNLNITNLIVSFILFLSARMFSSAKNIYIAVLIGLGLSFSQGNVVPLSVCVCWSVVLMLLRENNKIIQIFAIIIVDIVLGSFFNVYAYYSVFNILAIAIAGSIYLCIPQNNLSLIFNMSYDYEGSLANEFLSVGQMELMRNRITKISELFDQMKHTYLNLSVGGLTKQSVSKVLTEEIKNKHCKGCLNYYKCLENAEIGNAINQLFELGLEKKKVSIIDANNLITSECTKLSGLISEINNNLENYWQYEKKIKDDNINKVALAGQFAGTSSILKELSSFIFKGDKINYKKSRLLLDELTLSGVVVNEALVLENNLGVLNLILIVRTKDVLSLNIQKAINALFKVKFDLSICKMTKYTGWSVMCFSPAAKYEINVGVAGSSVSKNNISGDNFSVVKLIDNKMMIAISDGMGHGEGANAISTMALNLIENFYKSGFSSDIVLTSVNNVLLPMGGDNFTTFDACIIDKNNATADFIKVGSSCSVIKSLDGSKLIEVDNLPLGIVENIKIKAKRVVLKDRDIVVIASDGVVDSFLNQEEYLNFINNESVINVQMFAESILEEAERRNSSHKDDKNVVTFKISAKL